MSAYASDLQSLKPTKEFFVGIDSDGCAFDSMEIKHKECFCPSYIKFFGLQAVSKYARESWDFVNLYSKERGKNRFPALFSALDYTRHRKEVEVRGTQVPELPALGKWINEEKQLSNATLKKLVEKTGDEELRAVLEWSLDVNARIADLVHGVPPFPFLRESLEAAQRKADLMVVSQTPVEALEREWKEHDIAKFVRIIAGQEHGTKSDHLALAAHDKYPGDKILMIGDALGDLKAALDNGALFYPIVPGREEEAWKKFHSEGLHRFFDGKFKGAYQKKLIAEFDKALPEKPKWGKA